MRSTLACRWLRYATSAGLLAVVISPVEAPVATAQVAGEGVEVFPLAGFEGQPFGLVDDGRPATRTAVLAADVAVMPDATLLVADERGVVRQVSLDGTVTDVAGENPARRGPSDTPALRADLGFLNAIASSSNGAFGVSGLMASGTDVVTRIASDRTVDMRAEVDPDDVEILQDGSVLASDIRDAVVRRIAPDGGISAFAGSGADTGPIGDRGPATRARLGTPLSMALLQDGTVAIADGARNRVWRVHPDGAITTSLAIISPDSVAARPSGGYWVASRDGIRWITPRGSIGRLLWPPSKTFAGTRLRPRNLAVLPDGNLVFTSEQRVWLLKLHRRPDRAAIALHRLAVERHTRGAGFVTATVAVTTAGNATLQIRGKQRQLLSVTRPVKAGINRLRLGGGFASRRRLVRVNLRDAAGRFAEDRVQAWLGRRLRLSDARQIVDDPPVDANHTGDFGIGRCHRFTLRRVDCEVRDKLVHRCLYIVAVTLPRTGIPLESTYGCRRGRPAFREHP